MMRRRPSEVSAAALSTLTIVMLLILTAPSALAAPCWRAPVTGEIVDRFRAPACPFCAGKRGLEFGLSDPSANEHVRSVESGVVTFSGRVAGTFYVVVEHSNQWKITYGRLSAVTVERGQRVARGGRLGSARSELYFGLRVSGVYRDPEPFLGVPLSRPRLIPIDGTLRRAIPEPAWTCRP